MEQDCRQSVESQSRERIRLVNTSWHWGGVDPEWYHSFRIVFYGLFFLVSILHDWNLLGVTRFWYWAFLGFGIVTFFLTRWMARWQMKRGAPLSIEDIGSAEDSRLVCHGDVLELSRIPNPRDGSVEPYITRLFYPRKRRYCVLIGLVVYVLMIVVIYFANPPAGETLPIYAAVLGVWVYALVFPRYFRVSNGRFEILAFSMLSNRCRIVESVNLMQAEVKCMYNESVLWFKVDGDCGKREIEVRLSQVWFNRHEFVEAVFRAALCREPGPKLPEDKLLW